jgi:predicted HAD superfamily Cof-like phosphohydrolase
MNLIRSSLEMVREFHEAYEVAVAHTTLLNPSEELRELRKRLIYEEFHELWTALNGNDIVEIADALADLTYVVYGTAVSYGIPLDEVFEEVHDSNMTKLGADGKPIVRADGKVLKGPNFRPPDIESILNSKYCNHGILEDEYCPRCPGGGI